MAYARKRQLLFIALAAVIVLTWAPLRAATSSDAVVFSVVLTMIIGGYWAIVRLIGKPPEDS